MGLLLSPPTPDIAPTMSEPARRPATPSAGRSPRGQSLVEFALVLPMLLVLLLGIADFGRVFQAGIILEGATRDGAEVAAQELVQLRRNQTSLSAGDYADLHAIAIETACGEASKLNESVTCPLAAVAVCVHDDKPGDGSCGAEAAGAPSQCTKLAEPWDPAIDGPSTQPPPYLPYVELRTCYRFTTLFNLTDLRLPFGWGLTLGEVWLQRDRIFVAGDY